MQKSDCTLVCDTREKNVLRHEKEFENTSIEIKQITTGDYVVLTPTGNILAVIERKSLEDYAASLKDGRCDNKQKLLMLRQQTGCRILYIIEGPAFPAPNDYFGNIAYKNIESSIFRLMMRDCITVLRTKDTLGTAQTLARFIASMDGLMRDMVDLEDHAEMPLGALADPTAQPVDRADVTAMLTRKHEKSDHDVARELWSCFRGISVETADDFTRTWSVADILCKRVDRMTIPNFKLSTGKKINKNAAASLIAGSNPAIDIRMLSTIPMISRDMATDVIKQVPLSRLLTYSAGAISIIKVGKTQRNLGEERAKKILQYFNYKYAPVVPTPEAPADIRNMMGIIPNDIIEDPEVAALLGMF